MRYRLFLYKTDISSPTAPAIFDINEAISKGTIDAWKDNIADGYLVDFNTGAVVTQIKNEFTNPLTKQSLCNAVSQFPPAGLLQIAFISVTTSFAVASRILPRLYAIAAENDLVLYDAETNKTFYRELVDSGYIALRLRQQTLHRIIEKQMQPLCRIHRLEFDTASCKRNASYCVTLRKDTEISFTDRVQRFYDLLCRNLEYGESLILENRCFKINSELYSITYVLEGYKKHSDKIGFMCHGKPCSDFMHRAGTVISYKWMNSCTKQEQNDIFSRMSLFEMNKLYPNPADRFTASVNITKRQRKLPFYIRFSGIDCYGSDVLFYLLPDTETDDANSISVLNMEEGAASFILPFVEDVYPEIYDYYYDTSHLSQKTWERLLSRLRWAKDILINDSFSPLLDPYIERFDLSIFDDYGKSAYVRNNKRQFLYEKRYKVALLYDIFIKWSETQIEAHRYWDENRKFCIQGP